MIRRIVDGRARDVLRRDQRFTFIIRLRRVDFRLCDAQAVVRGQRLLSDLNLLVGVMDFTCLRNESIKPMLIKIMTIGTTVVN